MNHGGVTLKEITVDNWQECAALKVKDEQADIVPSNVYSIAAAQFYPDLDAVAIYAGEEMVGFAMYGLRTLVRRIGNPPAMDCTTGRIGNPAYAHS